MAEKEKGEAAEKVAHEALTNRVSFSERLIYS